ncbi:MAG: spermidine synthase [Steroidobacteraceae bacterium]
MLDVARRRFLLGVFVVSGFTGLIYESIWSHYLKLFLGHAAYAQSLVLAIFMGGMALGSWAIARYSLRIRRLLGAYVWVEGIIGALGVFFHPVFVAAYNFSFAKALPALPSAFWIHAYKWSLGALLIFPQSVLLGMTFPLISGGLIRRWPARPGETLATLYFTNSLGAATGVLISGFVLIEAVGLPGTIRIAGILNIALALAVWAAVRGQAEPDPAPRAAGGASLSEDALSEDALSGDALSGDALSGDALSRWFTVAAFLAGAASFMYELGWIRMLSLVLGSSTHAFELMLSAFIFGLAFGGLYVRRRIERMRDPVSYVACIMVAMGALAALTLPSYKLTFDAMAWFLRTYPHTANGYVGFNLLSQLIAALIMIPTTFCAGMTLPLLTRELMRRGTGERAIGTIYSANTFGAIVGVLLTIHLLMPRIGIKGVILGGAAIHIALGLSRLLAGRPYPAPAARVAMALCMGVFGLVAFIVKLDPLRMTSGVYRTGSATLPGGAAVTYLRDGKTATISLVEQAGTVTIATNGKPDAGIQMGAGEPTVDESTMVLAAAIPLSMQPRAARVANIGFGSGLTTHTLLASGLVKRLDSIEIEPFMVEAARQGFGARINDVFQDPRSHVVYEDAKTFFASSREPYDLIVSEPSNPWVSGVATLFSDEFYGRITHYLTADGYFAQWMQVYETNIGILASVIKALAPHFGAYALYNVDDLDVLIIATRAPDLRTPDERLIQSPELRAELARIGVQSVADFESRKIGDSRTIGPLLASLPVPPNSDFHPFVDLNAPRLRYLRDNAKELPALTVLPIPFLELLDGTASRGATLEPSVNSAVVRDRLVLRALDIRQAVLSGSLNALDPATARYLWLIGARGELCDAPPTRLAWQEAVRNISDDTAAYLNPAELEVIWNQVVSSPCYREASGESKAWVDLWAAIARRDSARIVALGTDLLAPQSSNSDSELAYLTTITAAADVRMGEGGQARRLLQAQWGRFNHAGQFDFALRELRALTLTAPNSQTSR